ncbi:hypothetical protein ACC805_37485, partial [Rhizobium ruizarguesonis]
LNPSPPILSDASLPTPINLVRTADLAFLCDTAEPQWAFPRAPPTYGFTLAAFGVDMLDGAVLKARLSKVLSSAVTIRFSFA